ncbi:MAG: phytoene desaturase family protein [Pseudomonadota bacterium]
MNELRRWQGPKIEGGVDAVILGATADALAAAALIARAGLHVVLIETGAGRLRDRREFAPGFFTGDGDPLASALDQATVDALDLYRHGLSFAGRRLETMVRFSDGAPLALPGDPAFIGEAVAALSDVDAQKFADFVETERKSARSLADWFAGGDAPTRDDLAEASSASLDGAIIGRFADARLEDFLRAEASLGAAARPSEAYTFLALLRRWAGDAAGLQGAVAAIEGGGRGLVNALRRAGQAAGVVIRQTDRVKGVIVEWDRVAGVEFDDGGQIRAPIIVTALPARESFLDFVGRARLDIEFARSLDLPAPAIASARAHLAVNGPIADPHVAAGLDRRFLFAPSPIEIDTAWNRAGEGGVAEAPIAELVFPSAFDRSLAPEGCATASLLLHPVANHPLSDERWREGVEKAAKAVFARLAPGSASQIEAVEIDAAETAAPPTAAAIERRRRLTDASGLEGYFFCGPEALIGGGVSLSAGRRAGERAAKYFRQGGFGR